MKGITKDQLCWVIIRCLGLFCLIQFVTSLILLLQMASAFGGEPSGSVFSPTIGWLLFAYGVFAIYCLAAGATLHRLLMTESPVRREDWHISPEEHERERPPAPARKIVVEDQEPVDPETLLTEKETVQFKSWLKKHPEYARRALEDQVALFRDAQSRGET
ncbi:MAG: hypothetical protein AAGF67_03940 [Verrucomicrobiota bacterium]